MFSCLFDILTLHLYANQIFYDMKTNYLLPNQFKKIGWMLFVPSIIFGLAYLFFDFEPEIFEIRVFAIFESGTAPWDTGTSFLTSFQNNIFDELVSIALIISSIFIALSKERLEDELISKLRLESLVWATYFNYALLIFTILFFYGSSFFLMLILNMFTILFFFIIRFNWALYKSKNMIQDEK